MKTRDLVYKAIIDPDTGVIFVSIVIFTLIHLTPGDPAAMMLGDQAEDAAIAALRESMGLNDPLPVQYFRWLGGIFQGDLGESVFIKDSMTNILKDHLCPTLALTTYALILAAIFAIPMGIFAAKQRGNIGDHVVSVISMFGISMPSFLLGLLLILLFAVVLGWLPAAGYKSIAEAGFLEHLRYLTIAGHRFGFHRSRPDDPYDPFFHAGGIGQRLYPYG